MPELICQTHGPCGLVILNRPQALNALTHGMVLEMGRTLDQWQNDAAITRIVITAAPGKAFCAGGDIRLLYDQGMAGDHAAQLAFWRDEYVLNLAIKRYPKPVVVLVDGIVMGGGVGVSIHCSHVVAGERFSFAMPEVGIGFFPDVGASYFLPRLPGNFGTYLALTGSRVDAASAVALGLARAFVPAMAMPALLEALKAGADVDASLALHRSAPPPLLEDHAWIDKAFAPESVSEIMQALKNLSQQGHAGAARALAQLGAKSPTSLAIARQQMRRGVALTLAQALQMEYRIVWRLCRSPDFYEGVRALVIDKDNAAKWQPASLDAVDDTDISGFFDALPGNELRFPVAAETGAAETGAAETSAAETGGAKT